MNAIRRHYRLAARPSRGVALITAVLITAAISIAAVSMAAQQALDVRRTANLIDGDRAYIFALGVESWVRQILIRDKRDNKTDHLGEDWAVQLPPITVEGATLAGQLDDLQGRYNLNNLIKDGQASPLDVARFQRLLGNLGLNPNLTNAIVDWLDADGDPTFPDGAEDGEYLRRDPPYRAANRPFTSPSELLLVNGITSDIYQTLAPLVATLPNRTAININTAPEQVLMALGDNITQADAEALLSEREDEGFENVATFLQHEALAGRELTEEGLSVASDYFLLDAATRFGRGHTRLFSVLVRRDNDVQAVMRGLGSY